ncbi:uncharacterized protein LOC135976355 isoform X2 [Chrysemys picta bellii]|uniref:uncharacterized protein LOC135976355 isoform X2 n=1 Tax=Chrysemys picta bellii TaxID=8478 RepID=UPI0032B2CD6C
METLVPGRMPRAGLLLLPLLLCFRPETVGSINTATLKQIVDHVNEYGVKAQYSFAVSLGQAYCQDGSPRKGLPSKKDLENMKKALNQEDGLYDPDDGRIVAARVKYLNAVAREHSEWRLLHSDQNRKSPVQKLLARTYGQNSCLIFFTLNSPCAGTCLRESGTYNIVDMVSDAFRPISKNYKAFVFQQIYPEGLMPQDLLDAWHRLHDVPLLRCDNNDCRDCSKKDPNINRCLDRR